MKKIIILFVLFLFHNVVAQEGTSIASKDSELLYNKSMVEEYPEFPGGMEKFYEYIAKKFRTPSDKNFKGGRVIVQFVVEKDGSLGDIRVIDIGFGTKEEAIRVFSKCPKWKPAKIDGEVVRCSYTIPINLPSN